MTSEIQAIFDDECIFLAEMAVNKRIGSTADSVDLQSVLMLVRAAQAIIGSEGSKELLAKLVVAPIQQVAGMYRRRISEP